MLAAGFSSLDYLKSRILPAGATDATDWDTALEKLGLAVSQRFEKFTNRQLSANAAQVDEFNASASVFVARAYPIQTITSVQIRSFTGTVDTFTGPYQMDAAAGLLNFSTPVGNTTERLVLTYSGGYWLDDGDEMPEGSTPLPDDILEAYIMQCQAWAEARQIFGTISLTGMEPKKTAPDPVKLVDVVESILMPYRRFSGE